MMARILIILLFFQSCISEQITDYKMLMLQIKELEQNTQLTEAKKLVKKHLNTFSDKWFELSKVLASINTQLDSAHLNADIYRLGHQKGYFYLIHPQIPQYKDIVDLPEFDSIFQVDSHLREMALKNSKTLYKTVLPHNFAASNQYPVVFIFHGGGSNFERVQSHWNCTNLDNNFIKVYLQSYRHYDSQTFGWKTGDDRGHQEVADIYQEICNKHKIDTSNSIVAGISAGGSFALDIAARKTIPIVQTLTFCPGMPASIQIQNQTNLKNLNNFIVSGEKDFYLSKQKTMTALFDSLNISYEHHILPNEGHDYPKNENEWIEKGLYFLNQKNKN